MKIVITGAAGFIGSHLMSACLRHGHRVLGIDNFLTGKMSNIEAVLNEDPDNDSNFELLREDIRNLDVMKSACSGADLIFHEAAIGSVPWSIEDPMLVHSTNMTGFLNMLEAARSNGIKRIVYASSSAVFGDSNEIPAVEGHEGACLSPYASSKRAQEIYAQSYARCYGLEIIGLRYFNVFGVRQDPNGAYAAVIPRWAECMFHGKPCTIYGDGSATRDYCHVENVVHANLQAAKVDLSHRADKALAFNIGCGNQTSLLELHAMMKSCFEEMFSMQVSAPIFAPVRQGDIAHSTADISLAKKILGFEPEISVQDGLQMLIGQEYFDIMGH